MARGKRLGEILRERGQISAPDLKKVLRDQQGKFAHLGEILLERKLVSRTDLATAVSEVSGVEYFDCQDPEPSSEVLELIPANLARRCMAVPVKVGDKTLTVVMARPQNLQLIDELQFKSGLISSPGSGSRTKCKPRWIACMACRRQYQTGNRPMLRPEWNLFRPVRSNVTSKPCGMQQELQQKSKTTPAVHLVAGMIRAAVLKSASDIHIEPQQGETAARYAIVVRA